MKIVMLGHTSAGKTTYVSLMYDTMRAGVEGFTLRTADPYHHRALSDAADAIRRGRYPDVSHQRASYDLVLQHKGTDVFPFTWRDYRGGALREKGADSAQARELHADLDDADAIVLFADAQRLATAPVAATEAATLVTHVMRAVARRGDDDGLLPVLVVFTKCDLVALTDETASQLSAPFQQFLEGVNRSPSALGAMVGVSCGPSPVNLELPVLTCLCVGLLSRVHTLDALVRAYSERAENLAARDTIGDRVTSWFKGEPSFAELAQRDFRQAREELARLQPLVEPSERLQAVIERAFDLADDS